MEQRKILIVDDEEDLVSTLVERLALRGYEAAGATSGAEALRLIREADFSVLILDVKMPGIDGLELMAEVKRKDPALPVILFTGHGSTVDEERGIAQGAFDYLMKPVNIDQLIEKVNRAIGKQEGSEEWT